MVEKVSSRLSKGKIKKSMFSRGETEILTHTKAILPAYSFEVFIFPCSVVKKTSSVVRDFQEMAEIDDQPLGVNQSTVSSYPKKLEYGFSSSEICQMVMKIPSGVETSWYRIIARIGNQTTEQFSWKHSCIRSKMPLVFSFYIYKYIYISMSICVSLCLPQVISRGNCLTTRHLIDKNLVGF